MKSFFSQKEKPFFALLTDFGFDYAVASMKGVILKEYPHAQIIDIDHSVKHFSILSGAFIIHKVYKYFPKGTIFICVIDPGVGSERDLVCLDLGDYKFVGPDNGLFHYFINHGNFNAKAFKVITDFNQVASNTFHGRDIFTPAAIEIHKNNYEILKKIDIKDIKSLNELSGNNSIVTHIDSFGNIKTNILFENKFTKTQHLKLKINNKIHAIKVATTFSDVPRNKLLCYKGSNDTLEIAANLSSAAKIIQAEIGETIALIEN